MKIKLFISAVGLIVAASLVQSIDVHHETCPPLLMRKITNSMAFYNEIKDGKYENQYRVEVTGGLQRLQQNPLPKNGKIVADNSGGECSFRYTPEAKPGTGKRNMKAIASKADCNTNRVCFKLVSMHGDQNTPGMVKSSSSKSSLKRKGSSSSIPKLSPQERENLSPEELKQYKENRKDLKDYNQIKQNNPGLYQK